MALSRPVPIDGKMPIFTFFFRLTIGWMLFSASVTGVLGGKHHLSQDRPANDR